jgi:hypothetical protein
MAAKASAAEQGGVANPTVRDIVREFDGLTSTTGAAQVVNKLGLDRMRVDELLRAGDDALIRALLNACKTAGETGLDERLGKLGREHVERCARWCGAADDARIEYARKRFAGVGVLFPKQTFKAPASEIAERVAERRREVEAGEKKTGAVVVKKGEADLRHVGHTADLEGRA